MVRRTNNESDKGIEGDHSFSDRSRQEHLSTIAASNHSPLCDFAEQLLACEGRPVSVELRKKARCSPPGLFVYCSFSRSFVPPAILIEGFGAGTSFSAVAGLIALSRGRFESVLLCLGAIALHPPTFCSLLRAHTFFYERDFNHNMASSLYLSPIILSNLYNKGISVLTLHDGLADQKAYAEKFASASHQI